MFLGIYEYLLFATTAIGAAIGGWIDFKTSEIPDEVPLFIAVSALILHISNGLFGNGWHMLMYGLIVGVIYLALGYAMYYSGQWGEADVLILAAIGFAIPQPLSFFNAAEGPFYALAFLLNTFIVGAAYSLIYSAIKAFFTKGFFEHFMKDIFAQKTRLLIIVSAFFAISLSFALARNVLTQGFLLRSAYAGAFIVGFYMLYRFAYCVDGFVFRAKTPTAQLREGDVLAEDIDECGLKGKLFIGLTEEQIKQIKKQRKFVLIKEGVRYAPTFFFSLLFTLFFGNALLTLMSLV